MSKRARAGLTPIGAPRSLSGDAADRIRDEILAGGFEQGDHLVEAKIAEQLDISRGPVREAFKLLRAEGLLKEEPRRGTFVVSLSAEDVREIYGLRAALEAAAGRLLARARDPQITEHIRELAERIEQAAAKGDARAVSKADLAFHEGLCELSGNSRLHEVFTRYVPTLRALLRLDEHVLHSLEEVPAQHAPLVEAIASGNEERASKLLSEHVESAGELIAEFVAQRPQRV
jgi:DNA-binding GntR family transcriptional regulator